MSWLIPSLFLVFVLSSTRCFCRFLLHLYNSYPRFVLCSFVSLLNWRKVEADSRQFCEFHSCSMPSSSLEKYEVGMTLFLTSPLRLLSLQLLTTFPKALSHLPKTPFFRSSLRLSTFFLQAAYAPKWLSMNNTPKNINGGMDSSSTFKRPNVGRFFLKQKQTDGKRSIIKSVCVCVCVCVCV